MQCWPAYLEETFFIYFYLHGYCLVQKLSHVFQLHCSRIWHVYLRTDHASTEDIIELKYRLYFIFYRNHIVSLLCFHIEIWCGTLNYMYIFFLKTLQLLLGYFINVVLLLFVLLVIMIEKVPILHNSCIPNILIFQVLHG